MVQSEWVKLNQVTHLYVTSRCYLLLINAFLGQSWWLIDL